MTGTRLGPVFCPLQGGGRRSKICINPYYAPFRV